MKGKEFYFVVRRELIEPVDDSVWATDRLSISKHDIGDETYLLNNAEREDDIEVVDDLYDLKWGKNVVILKGRFVTKEELDS